MNEYQEDKEVMDLIKDYKDLCEQIKNPSREGMEKVLLSVQSHNVIDSMIIELGEGKKMHIKNISTSILYRKLPKYKKMCADKLILKIGSEEFNHLFEK